MGRTLHYGIKKENADFTRKELEAMYDISNKLNSGKFKNIWSCENFFLSPYNYCPNWDALKSDKCKDGWAEVNKEYKAIKKSNSALHHFDILLLLKGKGLITFFGKNEKRQISGFTKTQGNEMNSHLVIVGLVEISKAIPEAVIEVHDEGELLICDLRIQNGKAVPMLNKMKEDLEYYAYRMFLSKKFNKKNLSKITLTENNFSHEFAMDLGLKSDYGDMTQYFNLTLAKFKEVEKIILANWKNKYPPFFSNVESLDVEKQFDPFLFCRPVDLKEFLDYKMSPATLMAGFYGEHWNLMPNKDAESESYKSIANIQKMFSKTGATLKTLGEEN